MHTHIYVHMNLSLLDPWLLVQKDFVKNRVEISSTRLAESLIRVCISAGQVRGGALFPSEPRGRPRHHRPHSSHSQNSDLSYHLNSQLSSGRNTSEHLEHAQKDLLLKIQ